MLEASFANILEDEVHWLRPEFKYHVNRIPFPHSYFDNELIT